MPYCTLADLKNQADESILIQLTDDEDTGEVVTSVTDQAIADAGAEIDGYCGQRYDLPFDPVPVLVRKMAVDIALYNLHGRRPDSLPEERADRYKQAVAFLRDVAKGTATLGVNDPSDPEDSNAPRIVSATRIFSRNSMRGW